MEGVFSQNLPPLQTLDSGFSRGPAPTPSQTHRGPTGLGTAGPGFCSDLRSSGPKGFQETKGIDMLCRVETTVLSPKLQGEEPPHHHTCS